MIAREYDLGESTSLEIYNVSTGSRLAETSTDDTMTRSFTQDGQEVWVAGDGSFGEPSRIIEDSKSGTIKLKTPTTEGPSRVIFR